MTLTSNKNYDNQATGSNVNTWGIVLNANFSIVDLNLGGRLAASVAGSSNVTVTANQAQNLIHMLTGVLTGNIQYILPALGGFYLINNATTGNFSLTVICAGGATGYIIPQGMSGLVFVNPDDLTIRMTLTTANYFQGIGSSGGSANAQTISVTPGPFALADGAMVFFRAGYSCSAAMTLNVSSSGNVAVKKGTQAGVADTETGDVIANNFYLAIYSKVLNNLILMNPTLPTFGALASMGIGSNFQNNAGNLDFSSTPVLPTGTTATTQSPGDNSTKLATTAFIAAAAYAPLASPALTGNPTAPTQASNNSSTRLATTAFANPGFSAATSGYVILPSGIIIQWGSSTLADGGTDVVTLPIAFPNNFFSCTGSQDNTAGGNTGRWYLTKTSLSVITVGNKTGVTTTVNWMAIGN